LGLAATWEALQAPDWTEAELGQLQHSWEAVDLPEALEKGFLGERAIGVENLVDGAHSKGSRHGVPLFILLRAR